MKLARFGLPLIASAVTICSASPAFAAEKTIGVSLPNLSNPYYIAMKKSFEENGKANGFRVKVLVADNDVAKQLSQVQSLMTQKVDAVALNCIASGPCVAPVRELNKANIPVFAINILPDPDGLKRAGAKVVQSVQTDQKMGGKYIGEQLVKDLGPNGAAVVGIVGEPTASAAVARDAGFKEAIAANPNIKVVALVNGKVEETTSLKVTTEMLQGNPRMSVVYSDTEPSALGALAAIQQSGRAGKVRLYAFVDKRGVQAIADNAVMKAGAIQDPAGLAKVQVDGIKKYFASAPLEPVISVAPALVNRDNASVAAKSAY
ncbi:substrate-binding domain-containing protein [Burkholderia ubonensis]|uniref:substrate-binding domain-containing protein n=1 Tax=Burkholderia ubonensis TaxID=101571 RepID=UPI0018DFE504|nr:substrate-binding domain-containing protein [Burkholderia ubonensis]